MPKFTDLFINKLKSKESRYEIREGYGNGFSIRVSENGQKSWMFLYTIAGKQRRMTFGTYPLMTLAEARAKHAELYSLYKSGKDPYLLSQIEKDKNTKAMTVKQLIDDYVENYAKPNKQTWEDDKKYLERDLKDWFNRKVIDITKLDVVNALKRVHKRGGYVGNRFHAVVRKMFNYAEEMAIIEHSPCYKIGLMYEEKPRKRYLSNEEICEFWNKLQASRLVVLGLRFQLLTAQREIDIFRAEWHEIDFNEKEWHQPATKTKNGEPNTVPLSEWAVDILNEIKGLGLGESRIFPLNETALSKAVCRNLYLLTPEKQEEIEKIKKIRAEKKKRKEKFPRMPWPRETGPLAHIPHFTPHDLRRTAATHMGGLGVSRLIQKKILNHVDNSTTSIYDLHRYSKRKRSAMEKWCEKLKKITGMDNENQN